LDDAKKTVKGLMKAQTSPTPAQLAQLQAAADAHFDWQKLLNDAKE